MSVKIKVSYKTRQELDLVLEYLKPVIKSFKADKGTGIYRKAYIELHNDLDKLDDDLGKTR